MDSCGSQQSTGIFFIKQVLHLGKVSAPNNELDVQVELKVSIRIKSNNCSLSFLVFAVCGIRGGLRGTEEKEDGHRHPKHAVDPHRQSPSHPVVISVSSHPYATMGSSIRCAPPLFSLAQATSTLSPVCTQYRLIQRLAGGFKRRVAPTNVNPHNPSASAAQQAIAVTERSSSPSTPYPSCGLYRLSIETGRSVVRDDNRVSSADRGAPVQRRHGCQLAALAAPFAMSRKCWAETATRLTCGNCRSSLRRAYYERVRYAQSVNLYRCAHLYGILRLHPSVRLAMDSSSSETEQKIIPMQPSDLTRG